MDLSKVMVQEILYQFEIYFEKNIEEIIKLSRQVIEINQFSIFSFDTFEIKELGDINCFRGKLLYDKDLKKYVILTDIKINDRSYIVSISNKDSFKKLSYGLLKDKMYRLPHYENIVFEDFDLNIDNDDIKIFIDLFEQLRINKSNLVTIYEEILLTIIVIINYNENIFIDNSDAIKIDSIFKKVLLRNDIEEFGMITLCMFYTKKSVVLNKLLLSGYKIYIEYLKERWIED